MSFCVSVCLFLILFLYVFLCISVSAWLSVSASMFSLCVSVSICLWYFFYVSLSPCVSMSLSISLCASLCLCLCVSMSLNVSPRLSLSLYVSAYLSIPLSLSLPLPPLWKLQALLLFAMDPTFSSHLGRGEQNDDLASHTTWTSAIVCDTTLGHKWCPAPIPHLCLQLPPRLSVPIYMVTWLVYNLSAPPWFPRATPYSLPKKISLVPKHVEAEHEVCE